MLRTAARLRPDFVSSKFVRSISGWLCWWSFALAVAGLRQPTASVAEEPVLAPNMFVAAPAERIPLTYAPASTVFAVAVRPMEFLTDKELVNQLNEFPEVAWLKSAGVSVGEVAEVMVIFPAKRYCGPPTHCPVYIFPGLPQDILAGRQEALWGCARFDLRRWNGGGAD